MQVVWQADRQRGCVSAVYAGTKHYGAKQAWVVDPEGFTKGAVDLAKSTGVRLIGRKGIDGLLRDL